MVSQTSQELVPVPASGGGTSGTRAFQPAGPEAHLSATTQFASVVSRSKPIGSFRSYRKPAVTPAAVVPPSNGAHDSPAPLPSATAPSPATFCTPSSFAGFRTFKKAKAASSTLVPAPPVPQNAPIPLPGAHSIPMDVCGAVPCEHDGCDDGSCPDFNRSLDRSLALLKSPVNQLKRSSSQALGHPSSQALVRIGTQSALVPFALGRKTLGNGTQLSAEELAIVKKEQRNSQKLYSSSFFFPHFHERQTLKSIGGNLTDEDRHCRISLRRTCRYICLGNFGCETGDCLWRVCSRLMCSSSELRANGEGTRRVARN